MFKLRSSDEMVVQWLAGGSFIILSFCRFIFPQQRKWIRGTDEQCLLSPAGVVCFVQVSVRKRVLPVQDGADQLPPEPKQQQQQQLSLLPDGQRYGRREVWGVTVRYGCVNLQPLSPLDRTTSQWRPVGFSPMTPITFSLTYCLEKQQSLRRRLSNRSL